VTDGTFLSRVWPSIVALVGTVAVVIGLLFLFGDDGSGGSDDATAGDDAAEGDEALADEENPDGESATAEPDADPTGDGAETGDGDSSGESDEGGDGQDSDGPPPTPVEAPAELRTPVGILNSTDVAGLAAGAQERFIDGGWDVPVTTNYSGDVDGTTAYYPSDDLQESAEALQAQFPEIRFVEPTPSGSNLARDRILVILADDYADAVGTTEESG
jgi:hypothetical protein